MTQASQAAADGDFVCFTREALSTGDAYRLMTDLIAPRPIAWLSTVDSEGRRNLAPFSYYQAVCSRPPMVCIAFSWHADGKPKDSLRNLLETREATISHVDGDHLDAMNATSIDAAPGVDEWVLAGVTAAPAVGVRPPRVADAGAWLECQLTHAIPLGHGRGGAPSTTLVLLTVERFGVRRQWVRRAPSGALRAMEVERLRAVGRLGGIAYTVVDRGVDMPRPAPMPENPTPGDAGAPEGAR